jgi:glycosyltransferase involved in cell wall biosynthesis
VWGRKREALARLRPARLRIVADSHWLEAEARRSTLLGGFPARTIHYGLDTEVFAPRNRSCARAVLGIPEDAKVVLFAAEVLTNHRKGFALLADALSGLANFPGLFLLSLGRGEATVPGSAPHLHLGYLRDDRWLSLVYSAADVFVIPSLQEAFGQTALEAMACGVPVVGFAVGGIRDMVRPQETGFLAPAGDVPALRAAIAEALGDTAACQRMSAACRQLVVEEFPLELQARRYGELYKTILQQNRHSLLARDASLPPAQDCRPQASERTPA